MKQLNENTWWKYLDGDCSEEERLQMESLLAEDSALAEEMLLRTTLHEQIGNLKLEQPSAHFSANVMAAIPKKVVITPVESLISPQVKKVFLAVSSLLFMGLFSAPFLLDSSVAMKPAEPKTNPVIAELFQSLGEWTSAILTSIAPYLPSMPNMPTVSDSMIQMSGVLLVGFAVLLVFDAIMKRKVSF